MSSDHVINRILPHIDGAQPVCRRTRACGIALAGALAIAATSAVALPTSQSTRPPDAAAPPAAKPVDWEHGTDSLSVVFAMPTGVSIRDEYIMTHVLHTLLRHRASQQPDNKRCQLTSAYLEHFADFVPTVRHTNPAQRIACLRDVIQYILHE